LLTGTGLAGCGSDGRRRLAAGRIPAGHLVKQHGRVGHAAVVCGRRAGRPARRRRRRRHVGGTVVRRTGHLTVTGVVVSATGRVMTVRLGRVLTARTGNHTLL